MKKHIYFENLDGLRFLCFLSIFFYHSFYTELSELKTNPIYRFIEHDLFGNGDIGVNFFFVLSGFLITFLLIQEKKMNGQINIKNFWIRRILRIWPLFYFCVFFGFVIFPFLKRWFGLVPNETADPVLFLTFLNNFDLINKGLPDSSVLGVLWSIAIEEQFYFIWPLILFSFQVKKLWIPFLIIISASLVFRSYYDDVYMNEFHTLSCISDMTIGAMGAWLMSISPKFKKHMESLSKFKIAILYFVFLLIFLFEHKVFINHEIQVFERVFIATIIILIILEQTFSINSLFKMSNFKRMSKLGIMTYGLYCLHFIGILITTTLTKKLGINLHLWQIFLIDTPISFLITVFISRLSYHYFETPFLKLKDKFSYITK